MGKYERMNNIEVYGYHGTSQTKAASILENGFLASDNDYDWLGTGIFFFQDAPIRAKQWAIEQHPNSAIFDLAHIQIAVKDSTVIKEGYLIEI